MYTNVIAVIDLTDSTDDEYRPTARQIRRHSRRLRRLFQTPQQRQIEKIKNKLRHERPGR